MKLKVHKQYKKRNSLAIKIFCALLLLVVLPLYGTAVFVRDRYATYFTEELSTNITNTLAKSEQEIERSFDNLANIANIFCLNMDLQQALQDPALDYYGKMLVFDNVVRDISLNNLSLTENVQITMVDVAGNVYSNWPLDFRDYSFLHKQPVFSSKEVQKGHLVWEFFKDPYIYGDNPANKYIGLARGIVTWSLGTGGEHLATICISIRQSELSKTLENYLYGSNDYIAVCNEEGEILLQCSATGESRPDLNHFISSRVSSHSKTGGLETIEDNSYLVCNYTVTKKWIAGQRTLHIYHFTDYTPVANRVKNISAFANTVLAFCLVIIIGIVAVLSWTLVQPIRALSRTMAQYRLEENYAFVASRRRDEIGLLNAAFRDMDTRMKDLFSQLETENKIKEQYKLDFLRAQLNPHFLFNTLGTVRWMAIAKNMTNIVECIDALGNMLRYSMNKGEEMVTLQEEMENLNSYIHIQNYRYGNRYAIVQHIPPELQQCLLIRFLLQPTLENAVLHAFSETEGEGQIAIEAKKQQDKLVITVRDNGKGMPAEVMERLNCELNPQEENAASSPGHTEQFNKIGVRNVRQQIRIRYGPSYGLHYESDGARGTCAVYTLPLLFATPVPENSLQAEISQPSTQEEAKI